MRRRQIIKQCSLGLAYLAQLSPLTSHAANEAKTFNLGVLPHISSRSTAIQYEPLRNYLANDRYALATVSTAADWKSFYDNAKVGQYDLIIAAAHVARIMQTELGLMPLASYHPNISGAFIAAKIQQSQITGICQE